MTRPPDQVSPYELKLNEKNASAPSSPTAYPHQRHPHQRQGDRTDTDDDDEPRLRRYVRYTDLVDAGIVRNWPSLLRLIDCENFPPGILLGRNTRVFPMHAVEAWLSARPSARKLVPTRPRRRSSKQQLKTT